MDETDYHEVQNAITQMRFRSRLSTLLKKNLYSQDFVALPGRENLKISKASYRGY